MQNLLGVAALAAMAVISGTASATQTIVGDAGLVIDVEFWGRQQLGYYDPGTNSDIITYGDPVHGKFRITPANAPAPRNTSYFLDYQNAKAYGVETGGGTPTGVDFVTSRWLSPLPAGFTHDAGPFPGSVADDHVVIGDDVRFLPGEPIKDWFVVSNELNHADGSDGEGLRIYVRSPVDFIEGVGLQQDFELENVLDNDGAFSIGRLRTKVDDAIKVFDFVVDRLKVTPRVCRP